MSVRTFLEASREIKSIQDYLNLIRTKNWDFHRRRIMNAAPSVNSNDYVIREELEELRKLIEGIGVSTVQIIRETIIEEAPTIVGLIRTYTKTTLTEDTLISLNAVIVDGESHVYRIQQDSTGEHLLTWSSVFANVSLWPISRVKNTYNIFEFIADEEDQKLYLNGFPLIGQTIP